MKKYLVLALGFSAIAIGLLSSNQVHVLPPPFTLSDSGGGLNFQLGGAPATPLGSERSHDNPVIGHAVRSKSLAVPPDYGRIPLYFIPNEGQVDAAALFYAKTSRYTLWLTKDGLCFDSVSRVKNGPAEARPRYFEKMPIPEGFASERIVSKLVFLNSKGSPEVVPEEITDHKVNYFIGNDRCKWKTGIETSRAVLYKGLYENVDLKIYGTEKQIEYDWVVKPRGNVGDIRFKYLGGRGTHIDRDGNLVIKQKSGELCHRKPVSYQVIADRRVEVEAEFVSAGDDTYGFSAGEYDRNYDLIIDPLVLVYSSYLGGSGFSADGSDYGRAIAVDSSGSAYVTGYTYSADFPTLNAYQNTYAAGIYDVFVTKFSADGSSLIYSTYLGGTAADYGIGIVVDSDGSAYVTGQTYSTNFPTQGAYQGSRAGNFDVFVTKFSADGASLVYSTYLGGSGSDYGNDIALDGNGSAYVTGYTQSTNFPTQNAYQGSRAGSTQDLFVTKFSADGASLVYSTYLGGSTGGESGLGIAVDGSGAAYITGALGSTDYPIQNAYQGSNAGSVDAFVTKFSASGTSLDYSTYLGGSNADYGYDIAVDDSGAAYVTGLIASTNFPIQGAFQGNNGGTNDAFVTKFSPDGTNLVYSTYLGGYADDGGYGIALDGNGSAYVAGYTFSSNFPTQSAYQNHNAGSYYDAFVTKFSQDGTRLVYSTFLGGSADDKGYDIAVDGSGSAYVTGETASRDFPTRNAYQGSHAGGALDVFVTKLDFPVDDLVGTWDGQGVYFRNSGSGAWTILGSSASLVACGDLDGDAIDDLIGIWPGQGGVWVKYSETGAWALLSSTARDLASGNMNADTRVDLVGTWDDQGVFCKDSVSGTWVQMASPADQVKAGDLDGDGIDDLIGIWPGQGGVWVKYSQTGAWALLSSTARDIAVGDMSGDGRVDLVGTWDGQGVFYRDSISGTWVQIASPADQVTAGDLDSDGIDDLIGIWSGQGGVWVKYSMTQTWSYLASTAQDIAAGKMARGLWTSAMNVTLQLFGPQGGYPEGPPGLAKGRNISPPGPRQSRLVFQRGKNLIPHATRMDITRIPGPGEAGFRPIAQKNLSPHLSEQKAREGRREKK